MMDQQHASPAPLRLWAYMVASAGGEETIAFTVSRKLGFSPLIFGDLNSARRAGRLAGRLANRLRRPLRLVEFTATAIVETLLP